VLRQTKKMLLLVLVHSRLSLISFVVTPRVCKMIEGEIEAFDEVLTGRGIFVPMSALGEPYLCLETLAVNMQRL
jgi:hypothetical protein